MKHLVELEQKAFSLQNQGNYKDAANLFKKIVDECPDYEFGLCFYNLAYCLEELREFEEAKKNYIKSIEYDNEDSIRLGGYASFLYLHGNSSEAFQTHLKLIKLEKKLGSDIFGTLDILKLIGEKIGLSEKEVINQVNSKKL